MALIDQRPLVPAGTPRAVRRIRNRFRQAYQAMRQAVEDTNNLIEEHGRSALATEISNQGEDPQQLAAIFNVLSQAEADIRGGDPVPLDDTP